MNVTSHSKTLRTLLGASLFVWLLCAADRAGLAGEPKRETVPGAAAQAVQQAATHAVAFQDWAGQYRTARSPQQQAGLHAQGLALAKQRRAAMLELMQADPAAALRLAVSSGDRQSLPADIAAEVETQVSGIGDLSVLIFCPTPQNPDVPPVQRWVTLNGQRYQAHVFGRRLDQLTKQGIPLSGIVLGKVMVVSDSPVRELTADEVKGNPAEAAGFGRARAAQRGGGADVVAEIGGRQYRFASRNHLEEVKARLEAAETGIGPVPRRKAADILEGGPVILEGPGEGENPPTAWTTGRKRVLIIRVDFSDLTGDPAYPPLGIVATPEYCRDIADNKVAPFYATSSYGLTTLSNTVTTQLYRMPATAQSYATSGDVDALHTDARTLAAADYTLSDYDRICVVFSNMGDLPGSLIDFGGLAQLGGPNLWVNGEFDFRVYAHELGHTYGLYHAALHLVNDGNPISAAGVAIEYGNDYDMMGANFADDLRVDFNMFYKNSLGWLTDSQVQTVTGDPATYRVYAFDSLNYLGATNAPLLALRIPKDGSRTYWLGVLRNFTDNLFAVNGVYTLWSYSSPGGGGGGGFQTALLDMNTPGNNLLDAPLQIGTTFTDPGINVSIRPSEKGGFDPNGYVDIDINGGAPKVPEPNVLVLTNYVTAGNGNGMIDPNECNTLGVVLTNAGTAAATTVRLTLASSTPGVAVVQPLATVQLIPVGGVVSNLLTFQVSTTPEFVCGTTVDFSLVVKSDQNTRTNQFQVQTGVIGTPLTYDSLVPVAIPDANPAGAVSPIVVSGLTNNVGKVVVALHLQHTFDSDLTLELIAPDGTTNLLAAGVGASGDNFGVACSPVSLRTVFDDAAATSIEAGFAPFLGTYRPQSPLSVFRGKSGPAANGIWQLRIVDGAASDFGTLLCWSLIVYPVDCADGGGQCPGADLGVSLNDYPDPAVVGGNLTYTITVTNRGPNTAKGTIMTHNLPASVLFSSATTTLGGVSHSGGVVTANLGNLPIGATATITVNVVPSVAAVVTSIASVTSTEPEINPADNTVTSTTQVLTPSADLSLSFSAVPNPTVVGGSLTYTATVVNNGPTTASGVVITNTLPVSVQIAGASSSQGSVVIASNSVLVLVGTLTNGATATATINVVPLASGTVFATARVVANQVDPVLANNVVTIATGVGQAADLGITITDQPDPIVLNSNVTYLVTVTNRGPNAATGVVVNQALPAAFTLGTSSVSQGSLVTGGGVAVWTVGSVPVGGTATMTLLGAGTALGTMTTSAGVSGEQADPNPADNTAAATTLVAQPFVSIVAAGATLLTESQAPANGAVDLGETVMVDFRLRNAGNIPNTNVVATLLATGGVTSPGGAQIYGMLPPGGLPVAKPFTFTASGTNGGTVTATFQISDGGNALSNVVFTFSLPRQFEFSNPAAITIPSIGSATPYPSTISVTNVAGTIGQVTATLSNLNHTFPPDVDVLLVGPAGQKVMLMAAAGGNNPVANATVTFNDAAAQPVPPADAIVTGSYRPASYNPAPAFPSPAPSAPYSSGLSAFANVNPNGTWSLYIVDRETGDAGNVANGWRLGLKTITPVNSIGDLAIAGTTSPAAGLVGNTLTWTLSVTNRGPSTQNGVVVTNTLSAGLVLQSAVSSTGVILTNGSQIVCSLGTLGSNATASVTIVASAVSAGSLSLTSTVSGSEVDLNQANNSVVLSASTVLPLADVAAGVAASPVPGIVGSNLTFTVAVTNHGPGNALGTVVTAPVPAGTTFQSASVSKGNFSSAGGTVTCSFGDLVPDEVVSATIVVVPQSAAQVTNTVQVATTSNDTNAFNNTASIVVPVNNPAAIVVAVGAKAITESLNPPNGAVDAGETVTLALSLANVGQLPTTSLVAALQAGGGVSAPGAAQNYGALPANGQPVARNFTFTAPNTPGAEITATLNLTDNGSPLGSVSFVFQVSQAMTFSNTMAITIPDRGLAVPYPSSITVAGVTGLVGKVTARLKNFSHSFPSDVDALLVGPQGQQLMLISDAGGGFGVTNLTLSFEDNAVALPAATALTSGTFMPTDYETGDVMPPPAPAGSRSPQLTAFNGTDPNGTWSLYVVDDSNGDGGAISGGWELTLTLVQPIGSLANLGIVSAVATPASLFTEELVTYSIQVTNRGPSDATGVQVTDTFPAGAVFDSAITSQGSYATGAGSVTFNVGNLPPGGGADLTVRVRPTIAGAALNYVLVTADQTDVDLSDNTTVVSTPVAVPAPASLEGAYDPGTQTFQITLTGQPGLTYVLQGSADLNGWSPVSTNTLPGSGTAKIAELPVPGTPLQFYRAMRVAP